MKGDSNGEPNFIGGKHGDITVTVAQVFMLGTDKAFVRASDDPHFKE